MFLYKVSFLKQRSVCRDDVEGRVLPYIGALVKNGQAYGDSQYGWHGDEFVVTLYIPDVSAVSLQHHSPRGTQAYEKTVEVLRREPMWQLLATHSSGSSSSIGRAPFIYLFTNAYTIESPIRCGHNGKSVPTYQVPLEPSIREDICTWSYEYAEHDRVWFMSGALEEAAYRQLTDPHSELSESGRKLCAQIEKAIGKPTYYYLMRHGRPKHGEAQRPCPGCGKTWQAHPQQEQQPFWEFHFKCDSCRLVSHCGVS